MATFYFNAAVDNDWGTIGNWWMAYDPETDTYSVPAASLPSSVDDVHIYANLLANSGSDPTVAAVFAADASLEEITITATGGCTFWPGAVISIGCVINGNCTFSDSSYITGGTINGNCTFNGVSECSGSTSYINGNCTFNDNSFMTGATLNGNCTFNDSTYADGTITGDCTFNGVANAAGAIDGNCIFNDNTSAFYCTVTGNCTFNDSAYNDGSTIGGAARFSPISASVMIFDARVGTYQSTVEIFYETGINGSSILGVI